MRATSAASRAAANLPDDHADREVTSGLTMWNIVNRKNFFACQEAIEELPAGQYIIQSSESKGTYFEKKEVNLDELVILPDSKTEAVVKSIENFWSKEEAFRRHGFLWKRGMILWGPPGSGKTSCLQQLSNKIVEIGGLAVYCQYPALCATGLRILRSIEPKRPIIVIIEDIDSIVDDYGESDLLALLDGELQIDNVVFIATTNYPERLDKRIINRPSRFDEIIYIGMPNAAARRKYLEVKNPRLNSLPDELEHWVQISKGLSIAQIKEMIVYVDCLGGNLESVVTRMKKMNEAKFERHDPEGERKSGFGFSQDIFVADGVID